MDFILYYIVLFSIIPIALNRTYKRMPISQYDDSFYNSYSFKRLAFPILLVSVVLGLTYETGQDYHYYYDYYKYASRGAFDSWGAGREIGFQKIVEFLSSIYNKPFLLFFLCALVNSIIWSRACFLFGKASGLLMFFIYLKTFTLSMNLYRQYIAMALILLLFVLVVTKYQDVSWKTYKKYIPLLLVPLAFFIHTSSLAGFCLILVPVFLSIKKISKWWWIAILLVATILSDTLLTTVFEELNNIVTTFQLVSGRGYELDEMMDTRWDESRMKYVLMVINMAYIWYADRVLSEGRYKRFLYYAMAFYFVLVPLTEQEIMLRIRIYLSLFMAIACGLTLYLNISSYKLKGSIPLVFFTFMDIAYSLYGIYMLGQTFPLQFKF